MNGSVGRDHLGGVWVHQMQRKLHRAQAKRLYLGSACNRRSTRILRAVFELASVKGMLEALPAPNLITNCGM